MASREETAAFLQKEVAKLTSEKTVLEGNLKAVIEEYRNASDEEAPEKVKKSIRGLMPSAIAVLGHYLDHGKEGTRVGVAKYVIDRGLDPDSLGGIDAEAAKLNKLLSELQPDAST